ncbi:MAG TPA: hypothetical protein VGI54_06510, partial [Solirubrobacteraceae bacterium]
MSATTAVLESEAAVRRWAAPVTAAAAVLSFVGAIVGQIALAKQPSNTPASYVFLNDHVTTLSLAAVVNGIGLALSGLSLFVLLQAVKVRRPAMPATIFRVLVVLGAVCAPIGGVLGWVATGIGAGDFVSTGGQTYQQAKDLFPTTFQYVASIVQFVGAFGLGASLAVLSFNALRVGLLPRFTGYVGIFAGIFLVIPIIPVPIILCFWLGALAALYGGRWPGGQPPAWETGKAEPWPSPGGGARG